MPKPKKQLKEEAEVRGVARNARTVQQQIALLDKKFGKDCGAKKERMRLGKEGK